MNSFKIGDLTIPIPIIQGGMGIGISLSGLASSVANMGGVGVISTVGIGMINKGRNISLRNNHIDALKREIRKARQASKGIIGVNIMTVLTNFSDMVKTSIDEKIDIIFSGAGLPLDLPKYLGKGIKTKLVPIVSSARAAALLCAKWKQNFNYLPDAFVVEGPNAGGHLGFKADSIEKGSNRLEQILEEVLEVVHTIKQKFNKDIPVIAAGGIYSGADAYDIIKKGASGVQLGTRFVATEECDASPEFKNTFVNSIETDIRIIKSPVGLPGRTIYNNFLVEAENGKRQPSQCKYHCIKTCDPKTTPYCIADALLNAYMGKMTDGFAFTGTNAGKVKSISTVEQVFKDLHAEYAESENINLNNTI